MHLVLGFWPLIVKQVYGSQVIVRVGSDCAGGKCLHIKNEFLLLGFLQAEATLFCPAFASEVFVSVSSASA